jgi:hypothetical protein
LRAKAWPYLQFVENGSAGGWFANDLILGGWPVPDNQPYGVKLSSLMVVFTIQL